MSSKCGSKTQTVLPSAETAAMLFLGFYGFRADHDAQSPRAGKASTKHHPIK